MRHFHAKSLRTIRPGPDSHTNATPNTTKDDSSYIDKLKKVVKRTAIWTAHCSADAIAYHLNWRVDSNSFKLGEVAKARGCSVRCVAE